MQLSWGSYTWPANSVTIATEAEQIFNAGGQFTSRRFLWRVAGYLAVNGQADCTQQMSALDTALTKQRQDLIFIQDNGDRAMVLLNSGSISGTRVVRGPNFPSSVGAEYATQRRFEFEVEAEYPTAGAQNLLLRFTEEMQFEGGGALFKILPALNGPGQRQLIYPLMPYRAVQRGEAAGYLGYPNQAVVSPPRWPAALSEAPRIVRRSPKRMGPGKYQEFPIQWEYRFESIVPLVGNPSVWVS